MSEDEGAVKDAISNLAQKNMLEFFQRCLLLEANLVVAKGESEQLLNSIDDLQGEIESLKATAEGGEDEKNTKIEKLHEENSKIKIENEELTTRLNDLSSKISTGYKPKIKELEDKIKELE
jgi:regulator of replication initiation timing|tara:strand:- start:303 stop:665 length:363 start_codon:yes stop_codon:yes gene_type:complete